MKTLFFKAREILKTSRTAKILTAAAVGVLAVLGILCGKTVKARRVLASRSGEGYVDTAVKILMAVVIGALVLAGLYALFGDTVMPTLTRKIQEMFNYAG